MSALSQYRPEIDAVRGWNSLFRPPIVWLKRWICGLRPTMMAEAAIVAASVGLAGCATDAPPSSTPPGAVADHPSGSTDAHGIPLPGDQGMNRKRPANADHPPPVWTGPEPAVTPEAVPVDGTVADPAPADGTRGALDLSTGVVVIDGLDDRQRAALRIIPESGVTLVMPSNQKYQGVDGFWLEGERRWFKIPGGTWVEVRPAGARAAGDRPAGVVSAGPSLSMDGLTIDVFALPASLLYQRLHGPAAAAGWQTDAGASAHPTNYPF